jgi:hypothetical protein
MTRHCMLCKRVLGKLRYIVRVGVRDGHGGMKWTRLQSFYCMDCARKLSMGETQSDILSESNQ